MATYKQKYKYATSITIRLISFSTAITLKTDAFIALVIGLPINITIYIIFDNLFLFIVKFNFYIKSIFNYLLNINRQLRCG